MALFKILRGEESNLSNQALTEGQIYFCTDTNNIYIDTATERIKASTGATTLQAVTTTSGATNTYNATVPGIKELTRGVSFIMIPHTTYNTTSPKLNVNGTGNKNIIRYVSSGTHATGSSSINGWLYTNRPVLMMFNGTQWVAASHTKPDAEDLSGIVAITEGGTGAGTKEEALSNLGALSSHNPSITGNVTINGVVLNADTTDGAEGDTLTIATKQYIAKLPTILSGSTEPTDDLGKVGDIYIQIAEEG